MMYTPEFIEAEVAYRSERIAGDYRTGRRERRLRDLLHLPKRASHAPMRRRLLAGN